MMRGLSGLRSIFCGSVSRIVSAIADLVLGALCVSALNGVRSVVNQYFFGTASRSHETGNIASNANSFRFKTFSQNVGFGRVGIADEKSNFSPRESLHFSAKPLKLCGFENRRVVFVKHSV